MSYFKLGEECILQSVYSPELNGDCVVTAIEAPERRWHLKRDGEIGWATEFAYFTTIAHPNGYVWNESALRKKHNPSAESLSSMIAKLNIKSKVESK
jgi:hypothetical protein